MRGLPEGEASDRDSVGRAAHIIDRQAREEAQRLRVAGMLAADADLELWVGRPAPLDGERNQLAHPLFVEGDERVEVVEALAPVGREEGRGIVARDAVGGL